MAVRMLRYSLITIFLAGCVNIPPLVDCVSRNDCARDEVCVEIQVDGGIEEHHCRPSSVFRNPTANSNNNMTPADAGPEDSGVMMVEDTGTQTTGMDAGNDCINVLNETKSTMHCTLTEAVNMASADDKIVLPPTHIYERISIVNMPLFIEGRTVNNQRTRIVVQGEQGAVQVGAAGTTIKNLEIQAPQAQAIRIAANMTLTLVDVIAAQGAGIVVTGGSATNSVQMASVGVRSVTVSPGVVTGGAGAGIKLNKDVHVNMSAGEISNCAGSGIYVESAELVLTNDTKVTQSNRGLESLQLSGEARPSVNLNGYDFSNNRGSGLHVVDTDLIATNGNADSNGSGMSFGTDGIYLGTGTSAHVEGNHCQMNAGYGIFCATDVVPTQCNGNDVTGNGTGTNCLNCN